MEIESNQELLKIVGNQNELIKKLLNKNAEKENMIQVLFQELNSIRDWEQSKDSK